MKKIIKFYKTKFYKFNHKKAFYILLKKKQQQKKIIAHLNEN
jgi:hypothetical protein